MDGILKPIPFHPLPSQGQFPRSQGAPSLIHPALGHFQGYRGRHSFSGLQKCSKLLFELLFKSALSETFTFFLLLPSFPPLVPHTDSPAPQCSLSAILIPKMSQDFPEKTPRAGVGSHKPRGLSFLCFLSLTPRRTLL